MLATGINTPVGIKLRGEDLEQLSEIGEQIEALLRPLPDVLSAYSERVTGGNFIDIDIDVFFLESRFVKRSVFAQIFKVDHSYFCLSTDKIRLQQNRG